MIVTVKTFQSSRNKNDGNKSYAYYVNANLFLSGDSF